MHQNHWRLGLRPRPHWRSLQPSFEGRIRDFLQTSGSWLYDVINLKCTRNCFFQLKMEHNLWRLVLRPRTLQRSPNCWGERLAIWIFIKLNFLATPPQHHLVDFNGIKTFLFDLKMHKIAGGWGSARGAYSAHCSRGRERWTCFQSQFLGYATVVNLNCTKSFLSDLKCTKIASGWGSAPDPLGELTALPQTP